MASAARKLQRQQAKTVKANVKAELRRRGAVTRKDMAALVPQLIQQAEQANTAREVVMARSAKAKYPCDVCGRESHYFRKWKLDDPRRSQLDRHQRMDRTMADTWCRRHAPVSLWPRWRKNLFITWTAITHPVRFVKAYRLTKQLRRARRQPSKGV